MNSFFQNLLHSGAPEILVQSLLHSLWQSLLIALALFVFLKNIPTAKSSLRYKAGLIALLCTLLCWLGTLSILSRDTQPLQNNHSIAPSVIPIPQEPTSPYDTEIQTASIRSANTVYPPTGSPQKENIPMHALLATSWSIGVGLMILRLCIALTGSRRHRTQALPIEDPILTERFNKLCQLFSLHRTIVFAVSHTLKHPGVIGAIKPIVLIPASMLTGFSVSEIEAVVAHELAHIRRQDYLFNLLQMVIESLFFFNPAVWWMSHRVRLERESCCDVMAMEVTGQKYEYANLLLNEFGGSNVTAMAFSSNKKADAKERLLRIVQPHHKIDIRISMLRLIMILGMTGAAIVTLAKTSDLAVETVAKILTPKQRVEQLIQIAHASESSKSSNNEGTYSEIPVSGTVNTYDGAPFPKWSNVSIASFSKNRSISLNAQIQKDGRFSEQAPPDLCENMIFYADAKGYAPAFSNLIQLTEGGLSEAPELTLEAGFPLTMNIINENGEPVSGAKITMIYIHRDGEQSVYLHQQSITGNTNGTAVIEHATEYTARFSIEAQGYQPIDHLDQHIKRDQPLTFTMKQGLIATGTVVSSETGAPIPNANFRMLYRNKPKHGWDYGNLGVDAGHTDDQGRFTLNDLAEKTRYTYAIKAENHNTVLLKDVDVNTFPKRIELPPERRIRGTVIGDLNQLGPVSVATGKHQRYDKGFQYTGLIHKNGKLDYSNQYNGIVEVTVKDGVGYFELKDYIGDHILFHSSDSKQRAVIKINSQSIEGIVIDLDSDVIARNEPHQVVTFIFNSPDGLPRAEGEVSVSCSTKEKQSSGDNTWTNMTVYVKDGVGKASFPAPADIRLQGAQQLAGYWIGTNDSEQTNWLHLEASDSPQELNYSLRPAGGITGTITNHLGQPLDGMKMEIMPVYPEFIYNPRIHSPESRESRMKLHEIARSVAEIIRTRNNWSRNGKFAFTSLPLGHTYQVSAHSHNTRLVSQPITLSAEHPIQQITLTHAPLENISVQVSMPDGSPASGLPIRFRVRNNTASHSYGSQQTDENGTYEFTDLNPDPQITYELSIETGDEWQPIQATVEPGSNLTYTLQKGLQLEGRVLDATTGKPLEGLKVAAARMAEIELHSSQPAGATTDADGTFSFSRLIPEDYALGVMQMKVISPETTNGHYTIVRAGETEFIELRVKPMDNPIMP